MTSFHEIWNQITAHVLSELRNVGVVLCGDGSAAHSRFWCCRFRPLEVQKSKMPGSAAMVGRVSSLRQSMVMSCLYLSKYHVKFSNKNFPLFDQNMLLGCKISCNVVWRFLSFPVTFFILKRKENGRLNEPKCAAVYLLTWIILSGSSNFHETCVCACCADVNKNTTPTQTLLSSELEHSHQELTSTFARHAMNKEPCFGFSWGALEDGCCARREISTSLPGRFVPSISSPTPGLWSSCMSQGGNPNSTRFIVLAQLWDISNHILFLFFFPYFLENHLTAKGERGFKEFRTNLHSSHCLSKKINICGHV